MPANYSLGFSAGGRSGALNHVTYVQTRKGSYSHHTSHATLLPMLACMNHFRAGPASGSSIAFKRSLKIIITLGACKEIRFLSVLDPFSYGSRIGTMVN
jgi:hypothetical protein